VQHFTDSYKEELEFKFSLKTIKEFKFCTFFKLSNSKRKEKAKLGHFPLRDVFLIEHLTTSSTAITNILNSALAHVLDPTLYCNLFGLGGNVKHFYEPLSTVL
jgi:hypothetical protein